MVAGQQARKHLCRLGNMSHTHVHYNGSVQPKVTINVTRIDICEQ
jgi:hypothetical protein